MELIFFLQGCGKSGREPKSVYFIPKDLISLCLGEVEVDVSMGRSWPLGFGPGIFWELRCFSVGELRVLKDLLPSKGVALCSWWFSGFPFRWHMLSLRRVMISLIWLTCQVVAGFLGKLQRLNRRLVTPNGGLVRESPYYFKFRN